MTETLSKIGLFLFLTAAVAGVVRSQSNAWNGITPLKSTRADVERILGKPDDSSKAKDAAFYTTKDAKVFVLYSNGLCSEASSNGWNVSESTVVSMSVYPRDEPDFDETKIDLTKFEKRSDPEILSTLSYINEKDGLGIFVNSWSRVVTSFDYFPKAASNDLKCKAAK